MIKILSALALVFTLGVPASAGQWDPNPETQKWFKTLKNKNGFGCCGDSDGIPDPEYKENPDGTYEVLVHGQWAHAPLESIINPPDRKVDYAIVWKQPFDEHTVRCFMPGVSY